MFIPCLRVYSLDCECKYCVIFIFKLSRNPFLFIIVFLNSFEKCETINCISNFILYLSLNLNILLLGSGNPFVEDALKAIKNDYIGTYNAFIGYDEGNFKLEKNS